MPSLTKYRHASDVFKRLTHRGTGPDTILAIAEYPAGELVWFEVPGHPALNGWIVRGGGLRANAISEFAGIAQDPTGWEQLTIVGGERVWYQPAYSKLATDGYLNFWKKHHAFMVHEEWDVWRAPGSPLGAQRVKWETTNGAHAPIGRCYHARLGTDASGTVLPNQKFLVDLGEHTRLSRAADQNIVTVVEWYHETGQRAYHIGVLGISYMHLKSWPASDFDTRHVHFIILPTGLAIPMRYSLKNYRQCDPNPNVLVRHDCPLSDSDKHQFVQRETHVGGTNVVNMRANEIAWWFNKNDGRMTILRDPPGMADIITSVEDWALTDAILACITDKGVGHPTLCDLVPEARWRHWGISTDHYSILSWLEKTFRGAIWFYDAAGPGRVYDLAHTTNQAVLHRAIDLVSAGRGDPRSAFLEAVAKLHTNWSKRGGARRPQIGSAGLKLLRHNGSYEAPEIARIIVKRRNGYTINPARKVRNVFLGTATTDAGITLNAAGDAAAIATNSMAAAAGMQPSDCGIVRYSAGDGMFFAKATPLQQPKPIAVANAPTDLIAKHRFWCTMVAKPGLGLDGMNPVTDEHLQTVIEYSPGSTTSKAWCVAILTWFAKQEVPFGTCLLLPHTWTQQVIQDAFGELSEYDRAIIADLAGTVEYGPFIYIAGENSLLAEWWAQEAGGGGDCLFYSLAEQLLYHDPRQYAEKNFSHDRTDVNGYYVLHDAAAAIRTQIGTFISDNQSYFRPIATSAGQDNFDSNLAKWKTSGSGPGASGGTTDVDIPILAAQILFKADVTIHFNDWVRSMAPAGEVALNELGAFDSRGTPPAGTRATWNIRNYNQAHFRPMFPRPPPTLGEGSGLTTIGRTTLNNGANLVLSLGDIVEFKGTAIVNAANTANQGGLGVDKAIGDAGGPGLLAARTVVGTIATGTAKTTAGFDKLHDLQIIHAVAPQFPEANAAGLKTATATLLDTYTAAFACIAALPDDSGPVSVAFPVLAGNIYAGAHAERTLALAFTALRRGCEASALGARLTVHLIMFDEDQTDAFVTNAKKSWVPFWDPPLARTNVVADAELLVAAVGGAALGNTGDSLRAWSDYAGPVHGIELLEAIARLI